VSALEHTEIVPVAFGLSDERLAARVPTDRTAFTELHERYEQPLLRFTRSLLRDPHDAADAAQEAWTRAFAALSTEPLRVLSVRSWLFAIARNACIDRMRDGKRCAPAEIDERALGTSPAVDDVIELRDRAREALRDLAGLSERQRDAVVLRDLNGLEGDDLARALHTDARRASWLLTDARRSLAEVRSGRGLSCEATRDALETSRIRTRAVRAHIAGCPECDGFARRRVARRVHLHGIAVFLFALPARLRSLLASGLDAAKPAGAIAAATVAAGVPAIHVLHHAEKRVSHAANAAVAPMPQRASAAPALQLPAVPPARRAASRPARAEASLVRAPKPTGANAGTASTRPAWLPMTAAAPATAVGVHSAVAQRPAPLSVPAAAPVRRVVARVIKTVTAAAPVTAPVARTADTVLAHL
jgi:RNA polymerase sigma-70 factor, ECF subfamily